MNIHTQHTNPNIRHRDHSHTFIHSTDIQRYTQHTTHTHTHKHTYKYTYKHTTHGKYTCIHLCTNRHTQHTDKHQHKSHTYTYKHIHTHRLCTARPNTLSSPAHTHTQTPTHRHAGHGLGLTAPPSAGRRNARAWCLRGPCARLNALCLL